MKIRRISFLTSCVMLLSPLARAGAKYDIRWVLAHDPSVAAEASAREFAARIEKETDGAVHVDIVKSADYNKESGRVVSHRALLQQLSDGKIEMTQMYTAALSRYDQRLLSLGNPYLFRDYDHAEAVFEGPLGAQFLAAVPRSSGVKALGITYSGGFGIFATKDRVVHLPKDMRGLKLQSDRFPWMQAFVDALGVEPVTGPPEAFVPLAQLDFADAVETTVARFDEYGDDRGAKVVNMTGHYLLTTMVVINEKFFESLPADYQAKVLALAQETSRAERSLSIKANEDGRKRLEARGVKFVDLTAEEKQRFAKALAPVYDQPWSTAAADWTAAIRATKTARTAAR
jgi:TRAP-type C4-dicarboxylate transport system substrate-binding protein